MKAVDHARREVQQYSDHIKDGLALYNELCEERIAKMSELSRAVHEASCDFQKTGLAPGSGGSLYKHPRLVARAVVVSEQDEDPYIEWVVYGYAQPRRGRSRTVRDFNEQFGRAMARWLI
jgi:hypothetical protein